MSGRPGAQIPGPQKPRGEAKLSGNCKARRCNNCYNIYCPCPCHPVVIKP